VAVDSGGGGIGFPFLYPDVRIRRGGLFGFWILIRSPGVLVKRPARGGQAAVGVALPSANWAQAMSPRPMARLGGWPSCSVGLLQLARRVARRICAGWRNGQHLQQRRPAEVLQEPCLALDAFKPELLGLCQLAREVGQVPFVSARVSTFKPASR